MVSGEGRRGGISSVDARRSSVIVGSPPMREVRRIAE
jgi:hypothetical protein